jgi:hypothetical protein
LWVQPLQWKARLLHVRKFVLYVRGSLVLGWQYMHLLDRWF